MSKLYSPVEEFNTNADIHRTRIAQKVNDILTGNIDCVRDVLIASNTTETTVFDSRISINSFIGITPMSSASAGLNPYVYEIERGKVILRHNAIISTQLTVRILIIG